MWIAALVSLAVVAPDYEVGIETFEAGKAPLILPLSDDLPLELVAPVDGHWVGSDGGEIVFGQFLPPPLDLAVQARLNAIDVYHDICQRAIDEHAEYLGVVHKRTIDVLNAEHAKARIGYARDADTSWRWYHTAAVIGGVLLGGLTMYGAAALAR